VPENEPRTATSSGLHSGRAKPVRTASNLIQNGTFTGPVQALQAVRNCRFRDIISIVGKRT
jgi:hypothetical protein